MENLFAYGTLMCEDIMNEVAGVSLTRVPASLAGYARRAISGERYPALIAQAGGCVQGVLYRDVPPSAWQRLDCFEGELYVRENVLVALSPGEPATLPAITYLLLPAFVDRLTQEDWDLGEFIRSGKASFQKHYAGFRSLDDLA